MLFGDETGVMLGVRLCEETGYVALYFFSGGDCVADDVFQRYEFQHGRV